MDGRAFLAVAQADASGPSEAFWRAASGRAYYALMLEAREALARWGFSCPPRENVHTFVRLRFFIPANADLRQIGRVLDRLVRLRNHGDYQLVSHPDFAKPTRARQAVQESASALATLDSLGADPARRAAAIAAIRAAFP